jgi:homoserine dehydrogenase
VVSDIIYAATHSDVKYSTFKNTAGANPETKFINNFESEYYIRLSVTDEVGILAKIMVIFAKYNVSIVKVAQQNKMEETGDRIPLIILTHTAKENAVKNAVAKINATGVCSVESVLRMER